MPHPWINHRATRQIVIIGAGGLGKEVVSHITDINRHALLHGLPKQWEILGFIDDGSPDLDLCTRLGVTHLGGSEMLSQLPPETYYFVAIGVGRVRRSLAALADGAGLHAATLIHPDTTLGLLVDIGEGSLVAPGARLTCNIQIGRHSQIHVGTAVGHDVVVRDFVSVYPQNALGGSVTLHDETTIGANSAINPGVTIGAGAYVGSGAAVTADVAEYTLVAGVPATVKKQLR